LSFILAGFDFGILEEERSIFSKPSISIFSLKMEPVSS
jgi:hypothetical protein